MVTQLLSLTECQEILDGLSLTDAITEHSSYYGGSLAWIMPECAKKYLDRATTEIIKTYDIKSLTNIYVRTYTPHTVLKMHTDQPGYDVTMTVCIANSDPDFTLCVSSVEHPEPWPFNSEGDLTKFYEQSECYDLKPGECVSMLGRRYPHWRPEKYHNSDSTYIFYSWQIHDYQ